MPRIYVAFSELDQIGRRCKTVSSSVSAIQSDFLSTVKALDWDIRAASDIDNTAKQIAQKLIRQADTLRTYQYFIDEVYAEYCKLDGQEQGKGKLQNFLDEFKSNYGWKDLLAGAGYIGSVYSFIDDVKKGKSWKDIAGNAKKASQFISDAAKTYNNYKKIGNAVGTQKATAWWMKNITGLKPLGRASSAKNPITRFKNNLTNKTSPFNAQLKDVIGDFKGTNGVGKAVAAWGTVATSGVLNWFDNKKEQANSNGTMSNGRVIAETITETVVDTVLTHGAKIIVGAAVTTAMGTVAAPGVLVVAATGLVTTGFNAGVKALTGKTTTEWISDAILDAGEAIGKAVGDSVKKASVAIGSWFEKLSLT